MRNEDVSTIGAHHVIIVRRLATDPAIDLDAREAKDRLNNEAQQAYF
jgi:hypothetical protein